MTPNSEICGTTAQIRRWDWWTFLMREIDFYRSLNKPHVIPLGRNRWWLPSWSHLIALGINRYPSIYGTGHQEAVGDSELVTRALHGSIDNAGVVSLRIHFLLHIECSPPPAKTEHETAVTVSEWIERSHFLVDTRRFSYCILNTAVRQVFR